jgi:lipopolysaccharide transport system ATP-binding protein
MFSDDPVVVSNVSKRHLIYDKPRDRLLQMFMGRLGKTYFREFWALKGVSFHIQKGTTLGILGKNGAGKSTLLQILCGTLQPTSGEVAVRGRVAALLELGSGFNPDFTGKENVFLNASLLGLSAEETRSRFGDVVEFADIGEFMEQPVRTYSTGMLMRLAFAVQAQLSPDVLIIDEALAVGDARFQAKCFERLKQLKNEGTSILLVTHSSEQVVTHCDKAILLDHGQLVSEGNPRQVVNEYLDLLFGKASTGLPTSEVSSLKPPPAPGVTKADHELSLVSDIFSTRKCYNPHEYRWGDGAVAIMDFNLTVDGVSYPSVLTGGQLVTFAFSVYFARRVVRPIFGVTIKTKEGVTVYGANSESVGCSPQNPLGEPGDVGLVTSEFKCKLAPGDYFVSCGVASRDGDNILPHDRRYDSVHLQVGPDKRFFGLVNLDMSLAIRNARS